VRVCVCVHVLCVYVCIYPCMCMCVHVSACARMCISVLETGIIIGGYFSCRGLLPTMIASDAVHLITQKNNPITSLLSGST